VITDYYFGETNWTIKDDEDNILFSSLDGLNRTECLSTDCYMFEITDTYGDGICCESGIGSFSVTLGGTEILSGGAFGNSTNVTFCVDNGAPTVSPTVSRTVSPTAVPTFTPSTFPSTTDMCIPAGSNCFTRRQGCDDQTCKAKVCGAQETCCGERWKKVCKRYAKALCTPCVCADNFDGEFLLKMEGEVAKTKTCEWLNGKGDGKKKRVCKKFHISQGYQSARFVCPTLCKLDRCF